MLSTPHTPFQDLRNLRNGARVTLYESEASCGGHTLTDDSSGFPVDLGFQVGCVVQRPIIRSISLWLDGLNWLRCSHSRITLNCVYHPP
jgi:hypothetical protein